MKYYFFWAGEFSNWSYSPFKCDGITFNCGEQYMMWAKAMVCGDVLTAGKIMEEQQPINQKKLGRQIQNYDEAAWSANRYHLVKKGLREKFLQNSKHMDALKNHNDKIIVEASPNDRIWGIGYSEKYAIENIDNWGENLLGKIITELASELTKSTPLPLDWKDRPELCK